MTKRKRRYRPIKCDGYTENGRCNHSIDIDVCIEIEDFDYMDGCKNTILVYCPECGQQHIVKL